jgi:V8-like Glu-specific endopeptidase
MSDQRQNTSAPLNIRHDDQKETARIVGQFDAFLNGGTRERRSFIERAVSTDFAKRFENNYSLNSDNDTLSWDLVQALISYDNLPAEAGEPTTHSLGALLKYLLDSNLTLNPEHRKFIATMIVKYSLVSDRVTLDRLNNDYDLKIQTVREVASVQSHAPDIDVAVEDESSLEQVIHSVDNFLDVNFLLGAIYCSYAVGSIETYGGEPLGTGFLVGPDWLLTNFHVLDSKHIVDGSHVRFNYVQQPLGGGMPAGQYYKMDPSFYETSPDNLLDYALVRLTDQPLKDKFSEDIKPTDSFLDLVLKGKHRGYLRISSQPTLSNDRINIIQHPQGGPKKVVMTQNRVVAIVEERHRIQYLADTMDGSSGSPVLNQNWEVVALHHSGGPWPRDNVVDSVIRSVQGHMKINEGIAINSIVKDLEEKGIKLPTADLLA